MSDKQANIKIPVDLTNPGQFFACCGLLELANCVDRDALGWFQCDQFHLNGRIGDLFGKLRRSEYKLVDLPSFDLGVRNGGKIPKDVGTVQPFEVRIEDGNPLTVDWWLRPSEHHGLKLWSGSNNLAAFVKDAFTAIREDTAENILTAHIQLPRQPFYYAANRPLHEREFGVSMDKIKSQFEHVPYVELLTIIALQRFRPAKISMGRFRYCSWRLPLQASIAGTVASGILFPLIYDTFVFPVIDRDDNGHKQFTRAERNPHARAPETI
jgi:hypothetical protein